MLSSSRRLFSSIIKLSSRVSKIETIVSKIETRLSNVETRLSKFETRLSSMETTMEKRFSNIEIRLFSMEKNISDLAKGLGFNFETLNAAWVKEVLSIQGHSDVVPKLRVFFDDPLRLVHARSTQFEVDVYVEDPLIVLEATSIVRDVEKLEKFLRKTNFIQQLKGKVPIKYFAFYYVDENIKNDVYALAKSNGVNIITGHEFCQDNFRGFS